MNYLLDLVGIIGAFVHLSTMPRPGESIMAKKVEEKKKLLDPSENVALWQDRGKKAAATRTANRKAKEAAAKVKTKESLAASKKRREAIEQELASGDQSKRSASRVAALVKEGKFVKKNK